MEDLYQFDEEFRDTIATVDEQGKRVWIYPKKPRGKFHVRRVVVAIILLVALFVGPFIKIDGHPLILLNIFERKFVLFGQAFWPQDFFLFVLAMLTLFVFIILFTVIYGRVWCGWACPQTIFMEMVFRKLEYLIEGDANRQRKLDKSPWNFNKIWRKSVKHLLFILISALIGHMVMAYLIGIDDVKEIVTKPPTENLAGFLGLLAFSGVFYGVFARFREQACIAVCPYGRLQGVLLSKESIVVAYDWLRGEPRKKLKKNQADSEAGDCIDCKLCVHACPTGIDIRNGTQLECVNCTACIDACNDVMTKINKPKGLIRFDSHEGIETGKKFKFNTRVLGYSVVLTLLLGLFGFLLSGRTDVETTVLRVPGMLYQKQPGDRISNLYNIQFVNKTFEPVNLEILLKDQAEGTIKKVGESALMVPPNEKTEGVFFVELPREALTGAKTKIVLGVYQDDKLIDEVKTNFLGPIEIKKP
ncbi:cytochrome c oxidase accessory protein CcoG [Fulvivirgaceae bacterium BMA12]|uniref:Cytochrome c oxidase accessory protein CcoG n=1 Tax=Agaribacillus aureus TaxID=3051825 RepID=A0ABT8L870_9BACT|nr:cytochrome c oxidase accessory protein CcoG [Fulvivirgaceae bacterium BMA12]